MTPGAGTRKARDQREPTSTVAALVAPPPFAQLCDSIPKCSMAAWMQHS